MAELADAGDLNSPSREGVRVRAPVRVLLLPCGPSLETIQWWPPSREVYVADEDDLTGRVRGLFERAARRGRRELTRAAEVGRHQLELREARKDLESFWVRLGKTAYRLAEAGELDHPSIRKAMDRIDALEARIAALESGTLPDEE